MTEKPYTDADVQLVAATFITEAKKNPVTTTSPPWMGIQTRMLLGPTEHDIARAVLDALAAAGRLAPADRAQGQADDLTGRLAAALTDVVHRLNVASHPGQTARHSGWVPVDTIDGWRALLAEHAGRAQGPTEPTWDDCATVADALTAAPGTGEIWRTSYGDITGAPLSLARVAVEALAKAGRIAAETTAHPAEGDGGPEAHSGAETAGYEIVATRLHRDGLGALVNGDVVASAVSARPTLAEAVDELRSILGPAEQAEG